MEALYKRIERLAQIDKKFFYDENEVKPAFSYMWLMNGQQPNALHVTMFKQSVENLASDEQKARWMPLIKQQRINGCYAQTEMGHGSNVAGLETTATLDKSTDEFVIHTPVISAVKMWPGDMGLNSTHAIVFAQLIIDGNKFGVQPFMVQIRSLEDHSLMPGVEAGDLGPKIAYGSKDNGYLILNQVRVPRTDMLMRFVNVSREGEFEITGDIRVLYSVMMFIRVMLVRTEAHVLFNALTIAIRYSAVRRQFATQDSTKKERVVLDYQTQ